MKKLIFPFLALCAVYIMSGCSEKFNVAAPYKNIIVIYSLLDESDTAHYVRIQKAFLDQNKSAVTMAQSPDSSYYSSLNVMIQRIDFQGNLHDTIHLSRVDLNAEGYPKQSGAFFTAPNYAYKFKNQLDAQYIYRLIVTNPATGERDTAESPVIDDKNITIFHVDILDDTALNRGGLDFAQTPIANKNTNTFNIYYPYSSPGYTYSFNGQSSPAGIAQAFIRFNWVDSNTINGQKSGNKYFDYNLGYQPFAAGVQATYKVNNIDMYGALASGMGNAPDNSTVRLLDRCDVTFYIGTPDYYSYYQASLTQGTGLTGSEIEPYYTNIRGANALGLFTSKGTRASNPVWGKLKITINTIDSLKTNTLTQGLRIQGTLY